MLGLPSSCSLLETSRQRALLHKRLVAPKGFLCALALEAGPTKGWLLQFANLLVVLGPFLNSGFRFLWSSRPELMDLNEALGDVLPSSSFLDIVQEF